MSRPAGDIGRQLFIGFPGTELSAGLDHLIRAVAPGGIVLFQRNVESAPRVRDLLDQAQALAGEHLGRGLWVAIDQEGGRVQRLRGLFEPLPAARELAAAGPGAVAQYAGLAADQLRSLGIHINFAPVLDLATEPGIGFLQDRCLAADPEDVALLGQIWIRTLQDRGISATAKHFPGLGLAALDPHHHLPVLETYREAQMPPHLIPFERAVAAGVHAVMSSHALYPFWDPDHPATLAATVGRDLLRRRMGFTGAYLSDDLDMAAIRRRYSDAEVARLGLAAGLDAFLLCQDPEHCEPFLKALADAVKSDGRLAAHHQAAIARLERSFGFHRQRR
ncbi:MAG: hypothetical protein AUK55_00020 [Syntrophobacteraceae bacterium CG2_30_61_12]|nr:MAG: hypothetical protein AUK55_00020 [Syntrophobacteraceae bacterium CG2_30_61_12]